MELIQLLARPTGLAGWTLLNNPDIDLFIRMHV